MHSADSTVGEKKGPKRERRAWKRDTKCKVHKAPVVLNSRTLGPRACKVGSGGALQAIRRELDY